MKRNSAFNDFGRESTPICKVSDFRRDRSWAEIDRILPVATGDITHCGGTRKRMHTARAMLARAPNKYDTTDAEIDGDEVF